MLSFFAAAFAAAFAGVSGSTASPYPLANAPVTNLYAIAESGRPDEELLCLDTLAGNLARQQPQLYRVADSNWLKSTSDSYSVFLQELASVHKVSVNSSLLSAPLGAIVTYFKDAVKGYVLCNSKDASTSAGLTYAAASDGVLVAASDTVAAELKKYGVPQVQDLRGKSVGDVLDSASSHLSKKVFVFQDPSKMKFLGDYAVFARAPTMKFGSEAGAQAKLLARSIGPAVALGWGPENEFVATLNKHDVYVHASDYNHNLAALSNIKMGALTKSKPPSTSSNRNLTSTQVHTVAFVMSDGDNLQWTLGPWTTDSKWFGNSQRGSVPLGWTFSPSTKWLAPSVLHHVSSALTEKDELIAGPSGVGYMYPGQWASELPDFAGLTAEGMGEAQMRILNVIEKGNAPPNLKVISPLLASDNIDGMVYYPFGDGYSGLRGQAWWANGKPVVSGRYSLWGTGTSGLMLDVAAMVKALLALPKDSKSISGYSIIPVHAWSHGFADVAAVVAGLEKAGGFDVVLPSELLRRVRTNLGGESCTCDHVGATSPQNSYTCTDTSHTASCSSDQRCIASGEWIYPKDGDFSGICESGKNMSLQESWQGSSR